MSRKTSDICITAHLPKTERGMAELRRCTAAAHAELAAGRIRQVECSPVRKQLLLSELIEEFRHCAQPAQKMP